MRNVATIAGFAIACALGTIANAQTGAVVAGTAPGAAGVAKVVKVTGTITAIDTATRDVTLKGPQGNLVTVTAGPDVKNFAQMKVGDQVDVEYIEALTLELKKGGGLVVKRTESKDAVGAKPGEKPAGAAGREVKIVADVVAVDPATQTVTLKGPQRTVDLRIPDPEQFKRVAKGDQVEATYTQAMAVVVSPAKK